MSKIILITGATAGFGRAMAEKFSKEGWNCIITGRRTEKLEALKKELEGTYQNQILPLTFDVRNNEEVERNISSLPEEWQSIDVLVNNAGLALGTATFENGNISDWDTMIDTNVKGLLYVSKAVIPLFIKHKKGHIVNLCSTAGKDVYPGGNVYCATKFSVNAITQAQRIDLLKYGIKVTSIDPGAADTDFSLVRFKGDEAKRDAVYDGYEPLHAEDIANSIYFVATLPPHVCINDLVITCTAQANAFFFHKEK